MAEVSRTTRVIQNAKVALLFYCINLTLQFFSRKIFLDYLGAELLGLNTTAQNLLQFLNLAESGIGAAVAFSLYKPLEASNKQEIINIVSLQGWLYRRVGVLVVIGATLLMSFFPWIFDNATFPLIYAYGTFIAFLLSVLLGYFVNYKTIVLFADQKEFKITIATQGVKVIKIVLQIFAVCNFQNGYFWWMILEAVAAIITAIRLNICVSREYPWLITDITKAQILKERYKVVFKKIKQLLFHRIAGYVLTQSTPLIIFSFTTLSVVAIYGNYLIVMTGCLILVDSLFKGFVASVGNMVAEGNIKLIKQIFWKILTLKLYVAGGVCTGLLLLSDSFIFLWVGAEYKLPSEPVLILILVYFFQMTRTCDMFISAYGLFHDIWAPIFESVLNLSLSIIGGYYWGLTGILLGVLMSQIIIVNSWKAYFLYNKGFNESIKFFLWPYTKKILILGIIIYLLWFSFSQIFFIDVSCYSDWLIKAIAVAGSYAILSSAVFYSIDTDFRRVSHQLLERIRCYIT